MFLQSNAMIVNNSLIIDENLDDKQNHNKTKKKNRTLFITDFIDHMVQLLQ